MKLSVLLSALAVFVFGTLSYGMDWQKEQDEKMSAMDKLIMRQQILLDMQVKYNEITRKPKENVIILETKDIKK